MSARITPERWAIPPDNQIRPVPPRTVYLSFTLSRMGEVDTAKQVFSLELFLCFRWVETDQPRIERYSTEATFNGFNKVSIPDNEENTRICALSQTQLDCEKAKQIWNPEIYFLNRLMDEEGKITNESYVAAKQGDKLHLKYSFRIKASFQDMFHLQRFPFDLQEIKVKMMSQWDTRGNDVNPGVLLEWDWERRSAVSDELNSWFLKCAWEFHKPLVLDRLVKSHHPHIDIMTYSDNRTSASGSRYSYIHLVFRLTRKPGYYVNNIYIPLFLITATTFVVFAFDSSDLDVQLSICVTLILTVVAFKLVVANLLPILSYSTWLDHYILGCMLCMVLVNAFCVLMAKITSDKEAVQQGVIPAVVLWIVFQFLLFLQIAYHKGYRMRNSVALSNRLWDKHARFVDKCDDGIAHMQEKASILSETSLGNVVLHAKRLKDPEDKECSVVENVSQQRK